MRVQILLPQWGMGMEEGMIIEWTVEPGDRVNQGDIIAFVETAKVEGELEAPANGVIDEILVLASETVRVGTLLAMIETTE